MPPISSSAVALVTAGSAGLGAAICRAFASAGARVVVNYAGNKERADALVAELSTLRSTFLSRSQPTPSTSTPLQWEGKSRSTPSTSSSSSTDPSAIAVRADISSRTEIGTLIKEAVQQMGRLDVVVSNQGWTRFRDFNNLDDNVDEEDWDLCFNMNVKSHLWLMHAAKPFLDRSEGAFVTTASLAGVIPSGSSLAYSVTKAAQIHLVQALAIIAAPRIRVNSVAPGILLTEWGKKFPEEKLAAAREKAKLKRLATVEDVADHVLLLAQSRSVTGTNSVIDAGWRL